MSKFKSKPTIIEATQFQWKDGQGIPDIAGVKFRVWATVDVGGGQMKDAPDPSTAFVVTMHGQETDVIRGDWIISEPDGRGHYPCKPDVFAKRYESVDG